MHLFYIVIYKEHREMTFIFKTRRRDIKFITSVYHHHVPSYYQHVYNLKG